MMHTSNRLRARRHRVHEGEQTDVDENATPVRLLHHAVLQTESDRVLGGEFGGSFTRRSDREFLVFAGNAKRYAVFGGVQDRFFIRAANERL